MTIYLARDGVEIGECEQADLAQLAREGQVEPTDYCWREGMEEWQLVSDFLREEEEAKAAAEPPVRKVFKPASVEQAPPPREPSREVERTVRIPIEPAPTTAPAKQFRDPKEFLRHRRKAPPEPKPLALPNTRLRLIAIMAAAILFVAIGLYIFFTARSERAAHATALFPPTAQTPPVALPNENEIREKATSELKEKIAHLPAQPAPPLERFFYDVRVEMQRSLSTRIPWWAIIRGGENVVDPETQKTIVHTDFILTVEYRDGEWTFKHYRASASDISKEETREIEEDEKTPMPPSIVGMLGLKMPPVESSH